MKQYRFQTENGYIADGSDDIIINDFIGEFEEPISRSTKLLIEAHGGVPVDDKPKRKKAKPKVFEAKAGG